MFGPLDCHPMALPSAYHLFWSLVFIGPAIYCITPVKSLNTVIAGSFVVGGPVSICDPLFLIFVLLEGLLLTHCTALGTVIYFVCIFTLTLKKLHVSFLEHNKWKIIYFWNTTNNFKPQLKKATWTFLGHNK